ncbi:MAG: ImmA/IrrE family metallo-endopeptidase [Gallionella sp.]|nr:ImmA/IrrE family metallo-endopeptidase [Gallionella sp.]
MTKKLEQNHIEYHIQEITKTAKNLQAKLIKENNLQINPTKGSEIRPIPIFEPDQYSLLTFTKEILDTEIDWPETEATFLPAYFKKYSKDEKQSARIVVSASDNYCEARFLAAKELMHCHTIDNGLSSTKTLVEVNELLESLALGVLIDNQTMADQVAWWGAAELLVPDSWIPMLKKIHTDLSIRFPENDAVLHIAQLLRVPVGLVKFKLK